MNGNHAGAAALVAALAAAGARAAVDVEIRNGDKVTGTISPATETETLRFRVPKDAVVAVKAAAGKKGPQVRLQLKSPAGDPIAAAEGTSASIAKYRAIESGLYSVEISSKDHAATADYSFAVAWKSRTSYGGKRALAAGVDDVVEFSADAGATATLSVKKAKKSAAVPTLVSLTYPDATVEPLTGATQKRLLNRTGDCSLAVSSATAGDVTTTVKIKPPKASKRKYALTNAAVGVDGSAFSAIVGAEGGTIEFPHVPQDQPGAQLSGSVVLVPAGALPVDTSIVISTAPDIPVGATQAGAGATVAFGPDGLRFGTAAAPKTATVTIPFDATFAPLEDQITIYTRDARGRVTPVARPYVFDVVAGTVSFATSHFSSFRAVSATPVGPTMFTAATILGASDVCEAHEPPPGPPRYKFFVASNSQRKVFGLVPQAAPSTGYDVELFAGGGSINTDGTPRLQFAFPAIVAVSASPFGEVFVASPNRIFKIAADGTVSTYAGTGTSGDTGDNGPALSATFNGIRALLADNVGNLYVADAQSRRIRLISSLDFIIRAWAGDGTFGVGADGSPLLTTQFIGPSHMAFASAGGLYVCDGPRIRRLHQGTGANVTVVGDPLGGGGAQENNGTPLAARFQICYGVSSFFNPQTGGDELAITDDLTNSVWRVDFAAAKVTRIGGVLNTTGNAPDASGPPGAVNLPLGVVTFAGGTVFVDSGNGKIRGTKD
jgi:molybdopterin-binding protein